ncbi:MAG: hypothetical protein J3R72DRAFT_449893 [Linnemannia gamsii]|nr:MAG: hypothetical protein J3R72DRAFT_449893 [Linnemannia gamsii]
MKSTAILAIATSAVLSVASAQAPAAPPTATPAVGEKLSFGAPIAATTWTAGQDAVVSWSNTCADLAPATTFPIQLVVQRPDNPTIQDPVAGANNLGEVNCAKAGSVTIKVPTTIPSGTKYSIWIARPPSDPKADPKDLYSYSALFTINNTAMPANTTTAPVAPTGTPTGSATVKPIVSVTATATSTAGTPKSTSGAGAIKAGSVAALAVAGAVAALMF